MLFQPLSTFSDMFVSATTSPFVQQDIYIQDKEIIVWSWWIWSNSRRILAGSAGTLSWRKIFSFLKLWPYRLPSVARLMALILQPFSMRTTPQWQRLFPLTEQSSPPSEHFHSLRLRGVTVTPWNFVLQRRNGAEKRWCVCGQRWTNASVITLTDFNYKTVRGKW